MGMVYIQHNSLDVVEDITPQVWFTLMKRTKMLLVPVKSDNPNATHKDLLLMS